MRVVRLTAWEQDSSEKKVCTLEVEIPLRGDPVENEGRLNDTLGFFVRILGWKNAPFSEIRMTLLPEGEGVSPDV